MVTMLDTVDCHRILRGIDESSGQLRSAQETTTFLIASYMGKRDDSDRRGIPDKR